MTVVIIEDMKSIAQPLCHFFKHFGWQAYWAKTFQEAKELVAAIQPDLMYLDLVIDDGDDPLTSIDRIPILKQLSPKSLIHVFSGYDQPEVIQKLESEGQQDSYAFKNAQEMSLPGLEKTVLKILSRMSTDEALAMSQKIQARQEPQSPPNQL